MKRNILSDLTRLRDAGVITNNNDEMPDLVKFSNHCPLYPYASADAIQDGFYKRLYGLQGEKRTWWTGSAFHVPDSTLLWRFTGGIIWDLIKGLK